MHLSSLSSPTAHFGLMNTTLPRPDISSNFEERRFEVKHFFQKVEKELEHGEFQSFLEAIRSHNDKRASKKQTLDRAHSLLGQKEGLFTQFQNILLPEP